MYSSFRPCDKNDIEFIVNCEAAVSHKYIHAWKRETHLAKIHDPTIMYFAGLDENNKIRSYSILRQSSENKIEWIRVAVEAPGKGFGKPFMMDILNYLSELKQYKYVWLDVYEANQQARNVYNSLSFVETSISPAPVNSPESFGNLVILRRELF